MNRTWWYPAKFSKIKDYRYYSGKAGDSIRTVTSKMSHPVGKSQVEKIVGKVGD